MSGWDDYVKNQLMSRHKDMVSAGIYGMDGSKWASEGDLQPQKQELERIISVIKGNSSDMSGMKINGQSFLCLTTDTDDGTMVLSRHGATSDKEKNVVTLCVANQAVVVGAINGSHNGGSLRTIVGALRDYLKGQNM